jgi:hypothetical protein
MENYIIPNWPAPKNICAYSTLRYHPLGKSVAPYDNFNLATYVGDNIDNVQRNREILRKDLTLPQEPYWLKQEHTTNVIFIETATQINEPIADASYTAKENIICAALTADCLPVLICDKSGSFVAAIHAGWKGLAAGVIEAAVNSIPIEKDKLMAWLGPAIGPKSFVVGDDVKQQFVNHDKKAAAAFIAKKAPGKWFCDIYLLGKQRLHNTGVKEIYGGEFCTYSEPQKFYSFRRDNGATGRMATIIYKTS